MTAPLTHPEHLSAGGIVRPLMLVGAGTAAVGIVVAVFSVPVLLLTDADADLVQADALLIAWATAAVAFAFVAGLVRSRLAVEQTVRALTVEQHRLEREAEVAAREAQDSRARLAESADAERRRIERDLHDGAQQRLVAMRIELGLIEDMLHDDPDSAAARIRELEASADEALEELRALAHGVRPPLLNDRGLPDALRAALTRSALPAAFQADGVGRYPPAVESAVYFSVLEALQNVAKHARGVSHVTVHLRGDPGGELRFEVHDDGRGADREALEHGEGIMNMRDRIAAVDGTLGVVSLEGLGTVVAGHIPLSRVRRTQIIQEP